MFLKEEESDELHVCQRSDSHGSKGCYVSYTTLVVQFERPNVDLGRTKKKVTTSEGEGVKDLTVENS